MLGNLPTPKIGFDEEAGSARDLFDRSQIHVRDGLPPQFDTDLSEVKENLRCRFRVLLEKNQSQHRPREKLPIEPARAKKSSLMNF